MRIPFVGPSSQVRSLAAAASENTNLYVEMIEDPEDRSKNVAVLYGAPGKHLFADLDFANDGIRGFWSGGGRLFVAQGTDLVEVDSGGNVVSRTTYTALIDGLPVQMFGNGNQLLLVSGGQAYIDNGAGLVACRFLIQGTVTVAGTAVTWQSGDQFTAAMQGQEVTIDGQELLCSAFIDATHITLSAGLSGTGMGTVSTFFDAIYWESGDTFSDSWVGLPITINGIEFIVKSVISPQALLITIPAAGQQASVAYSVVRTNLTYSAAGGDLVTALTGGYLDGSFYVQRPAGGSPDLGRQVNFSDPFDGTTWRGLSFKTKEGASDYIQGILVDAEILYVFGTESTEGWQNDPTTGLPVRIPGAMQKYGAASRWGQAAINSKVYFIGGDSQGGIVAYRIDGASPTRISTHAEESTWAKDGLGINCICYTYMEQGHVFWVINFGSQAWAWDETSKTWARRMRWDGAAFGPGYPTFYHTYIAEWGNGKHITGGDLLTGNVYESSVEFYDDNGSDMAWRRAIPYRYNGGKQLYWGAMNLEMETGTVPSGPEPTITRDYSDDRGETFIHPQAVGIGAHDQFDKVVKWPTGGSSYGRVWRFFGSGQYKVALIDLQCEEMAGTV